LLAPTALWDLLVTAILRGGMYALTAVGLSLVFGVMNIPHFAHGEFYMLGAYTSYFAYRYGAPPALAILSGALVGLLAGALVERFVFCPLRWRRQEQWVLNTFLVTVGLSFVMQNATLALWGGKYRGIARYWEGTLPFGFGMRVAVDRVAALLIAIFCIAGFGLFVKYTRTGRAIRAVAQNETGALLVGINLNQVYTLTFGLGSMLAAVAGASLISVSPAYPTMGLAPLYKSWYVVILVGLGNVAAAIPGGFIVGLIETISYYAFGAGWQEVVNLSILILILLVRPAGLFGSRMRHFSSDRSATRQ
jgi:branched-chain amino acid transport system permease protein